MARERIIILGGGAAALATAFDLTREPDWQQHRQVTLYTQGWRLGGKGASSRDPKRGGRIVEHGLHVLLGYYNHVFRMMRQTYQELDRPENHPFSTWRSAVEPVNRTAVMEQVDGKWVPWDLVFPVVPGMPGEGDAEVPDAGQALRQLVGWIGRVSMGGHAHGAHDGSESSPIPPQTGFLSGLLKTQWSALEHWGPNPDDVSRLLDRVGSLHGDLNLDATAIDPEGLFLPPGTNLRQLTLLIRESLRRSQSTDLHIRRMLTALDLACAAVKGMLADNVIFRGFDPLDGEELRDWLRRHGASAESVSSTLVRSVYDLTFAYRDGDPSQPALAAGAGLRGALRLFFGYRGGFLWKMNAGMGEVVFAPLYQVLAARGVQFRFFHKVRALKAKAGRIRTVVIGRQATERKVYQPLIDVAGVPCWPLTPLWDQLQEGPALRAGGIDLEDEWNNWPDVQRLKLRDGRDFDRVILGIAVGALPAICQDLAKKKRRWRKMLNRAATVPTQSVQLWLSAPTESLGWRPDGTLLGGFASPFEIWADMTHMLTAEPWDSPAPVQLSYLLGVMRDDDAALTAATDNYPAQAKARVRAELEGWLREDSSGLWPDAQQPNERGFRWDLLVDPLDREGPERLDYHVVRANVQPSDRYVQTLPGATRARIRPGRTGFENLLVCGDWTRNGMNVGSIEAAVLSGLIAGRLARGEKQTDAGKG
jgi:uncharacterized protein with NAD-binding domain and iron-sulfur cluster